MKLHREQFLAAAMMLSASGTLGACRSKPDAGNEGINAEGAQNIGQNGPNAEPGGSLMGRSIQPGAKVGATPVRVGPANEGVIAPTKEAPFIAAPTREAPFIVAPTRETPGVVAPTREAPGVVAPTREAPFVPPRLGATTPAKTVTPPPPLAPRK